MLPESILKLAEQIAQLPGFGRRSSQKLALDLLQISQESFDCLLEKLQLARQTVIFCTNCGFFAQQELIEKEKNCQKENWCQICKNDKRDKYQICLVEKPTDVLNIEKSQIYTGQYHVLGKLISPLENIYTEQTNLPDLYDRRLPELINNLQKINLPEKHPQELSINFNPLQKQIELIIFFKESFASQATLAYLQEIIQNRNWQKYLKITKLAQGLPLYYNPDNLDQATIIKALEDRRQIF